MIKYVFREPVTIKGADKASAQKIGEALQKLAGDAEELTPIMVVEAAKSPRSFLHPFFEWDDRVAAQKFRLDQARVLIRSIQVEDGEFEAGCAPAFISISDKAGTSYRTLGSVKNSADLQAHVLEQATKDLESWERRYRALKDVCSVIAEARAMLAKKRRKATDSRAGASAH